MADFRVARHGDWKSAAQDEPDQPAPAPPPPAVVAQRLASEVQALGAWSVPARLFDRIFGGVAHRRRSVLIGVQAVLVLLAVLLITNGVAGTAVVAYDVGDWRPAGDSGTVHAYIAPGSSHRYIVDVVAASGQTGAVFGAESGRVTVPSFAPGSTAYGLELRLMRLEPHLRPHVLVAAPGESLRTVQPVVDDDVLMRYEPGRFQESGRYQIVITSKEGVGPVEMRLAVMRAPVERTEASTLDWLPLVGGGGLVIVALGAVAPGARLLRERRRLLAREEDRFYAARATSIPLRQKGFARIRPFRRGVLAWERPAGGAPERLARLPGHGWVIRLD